MPEVGPPRPMSAVADVSRPNGRRLWIAFGVFTLVVAVVLVALLEIALVVMLNHPPPITLLRRVLAGYYTEVDRAILQFLPDCAQYDVELGYTLRPGACRFKNRGFDTRIDVNRAGLRDAETALDAPEIIVLGDSHAMGWGVEGHESFPSVLEQACGMKVLNAAISSYGTAREMHLLRRLDRSALKWVIIQYSDNDERENLEFKDRGRLTAMTSENYSSLQDMVMRRTSYTPGQHVFRFFPHLSKRLSRRSPVQAPGPGDESAVPRDARKDTEIAVFMHALKSMPDLPPDARIAVFEINGRYARPRPRGRQSDRAFAAALKAELATAARPSRHSILVLDPAAALEYDHFLPLDEHMSAAGHRLVGGEIAKALACHVPPQRSAVTRVN